MSPASDRRTLLACLGSLGLGGCLGVGTAPESGSESGSTSAPTETAIGESPTEPTDDRRPSTDRPSTTHRTETPPGTAGLPTRFWLDPVDLSADERGSVDPIVFSELPEDEQEIVRTALEEGEYAVDSDAYTPGLDSLRDRIERRADGGLVVYLRRGETYYRVGFAAGDYVIAYPDA